MHRSLKSDPSALFRGTPVQLSPVASYIATYNNGNTELLVVYSLFYLKL